MAREDLKWNRVAGAKAGWRWREEPGESLGTFQKGVAIRFVFQKSIGLPGESELKEGEPARRVAWPGGG